jgi:PAS domain-containing protein
VEHEPEARRAEQYAGLILDAIPTLLGLATPEGLVEFANRRWLAYTGLTNDQAQGHGYLRTFHRGRPASFALISRCADRLEPAYRHVPAGRHFAVAP